jgi:hypothetical protein
MAGSGNDATTRDLYVDLLQKILINEIYRDPPILTTRDVRRARRQGRLPGGFAEDQRKLGRDWPSVAHSMIGRQRLDNLRHCTEAVLRAGVPGDLIETGVWRGGACILMRGILRAWGVTDRRVWVADSFAGLPPPNASAYPADAGDRHHTVDVLAVPLEQVQANFAAYGLLDDQVRFLKGWFRDTLPVAPIERLALIRLDGDMYESTMDGFRALYHKLSPGGFLIVDDYHAVKGCKAAVHDFIATLDPAETVDLCEIDGTGVFWQRRFG